MSEHVKIHKALLPLSWIYGLVVGLRNKFFDWGILSTEEFSVPVISIGNLAVGGTGKTPHTEYLIRLLSKKYKIAVLSRGYKRKTSGFVLAEENVNSHQIGDEPYQMFRKFPGITVAVDGNRKRGIKQLLSLPEEKRPEVILLDDAFQHRYVLPSLSILLSDSNRLYYKDALLPAGRLREIAKNNSRAQIVIVTKCSKSFKPIDYRIISEELKLAPCQQLFFTSYKYAQLMPVFPEYLSDELTPQSLENGDCSILLVTGIAYPENLIDQVKKYTPRLSTLIYADHHDFTSGDIQQISSRFQQLSGANKIIITTEKDAVRLMDNKHFSSDLKPVTYYLPIEVVFNLDQEGLFIQNIENHVTNFKRNRILA